jgi:hypothetical protein
MGLLFVRGMLWSNHDASNKPRTDEVNTRVFARGLVLMRTRPSFGKSYVMGCVPMKTNLNP